MECKEDDLLHGASAAAEEEEERKEANCPFCCAICYGVRLLLLSI